MMEFWVRSEIGYEKSHILVRNRVRVFRSALQPLTKFSGSIPQPGGGGGVGS